MTIVQLECVLEAARQGNFSLAAANLYLSQPTLSRHIQALEEELGAPVFVRANNMVRLTAVGGELLPKLERMYEEFQRGAAELHEIADRLSGGLKIGVLASLAVEDSVRDAAKKYRGEHPEAELSFYHLDLRESYDLLMSGKVDLLLSLDSSMPPSDRVRALPLRRERMCLAVPADHPNAGLAEIAHGEIGRYFPDLKFCVMDVGEFKPPVQNELRAIYTDYDAPAIGKLSGDMAGLDTLLLLADAGVSATCVNENCILKNNPRVRMIPLVERGEAGAKALYVTVALYWVEKNVNPVLRSFLKLF